VLFRSHERSHAAPTGATSGESLDGDLPWILLGVGGGVVMLGVVIGVAVGVSSSNQSPTFDAPVVIGW
jgi:hypothetical protein